LTKKKNNIIATDAFKILIINAKPEVTGDEICLIGGNKKKKLSELEAELNEGNKDEKESAKKTITRFEKTKDGCLIVDGTFPNYDRVIPREFDTIVTLKTYDLYKFGSIVLKHKLSSVIMHTIILKHGEQKIGMNAAFLTEMCSTMMMLGHKEVDLLLINAANKPVVIIPKGNVRKIGYNSIDTDLGVLMPTRLDDSMITDKEDFRWIYDLEKNCIETESLEDLGCVGISDDKEIEPEQITAGKIVADKKDKHTYYVKSISGDKLFVVKLNDMSDDEIEAKDVYLSSHQEDLLAYYKAHKDKAEAQSKYPIVLEWTEGAGDIENKGYNSLEELEKDLKSFGFTDKPKETYIKNKVLFKDYPSAVRIDLSKSGEDYDPTKEKLVDWMKKYDSAFDFSQFSSEEKEKKSKAKQDEA